MAAPKVFLTPDELTAAHEKYRAVKLIEVDEKVRARFIAKFNDVKIRTPLGKKDLDFYTYDAPMRIVRELKESGWETEFKPYIHEHSKKCRNEKNELVCDRFTDIDGIYGEESVPFWTLSQPFVPKPPKPIIESVPIIEHGHGGPDTSTDTDAKDGK